MSGHHPIPPQHLPEYVTGSSFDPDVLRAAAEAHSRSQAASSDFTVKPWLVLYLLAVWEAACDAATRTTSVHEAQGRLLDALNGGAA